MNMDDLLKLKPEDWHDFAERFFQAQQFLQARAEYREYLELKIARERALGDEHRAFLDERIAELVNNGQPNKMLYVPDPEDENNHDGRLMYYLLNDPDGGQPC